ncbi:MAG TPA: mandelate racemase/muconate lactonizing enzyme family protein [Bryobacteraceae bacterium]|nr:mandelate racemase/muconate lactonizing enzyme family protein [Bryobacteraceae bacterium]
MSISRRHFLLTTAALAAAQEKRVIPWYEEPALGIPRKVKTPVKIASIQLLRTGSNYFLEVTSTDGVKGICRTKQIDDYIAILYRRVVPTFIGKDARDIETLVDDVYTANYKLAGQAFWCPVAYVEQAIFDLLGKTAKLPVGELLGGVIRKEIPVYLSGSGRDTKAEEEVDVYVRGVAETNAKAVKFKIGGRMSRNLDAYPGRTETMMKLARKRLGDKIVINADANGSYNAEKAIDVGRMLQDLNVNFFEEPCPWEELGETKKVADALSIKIAAGEQDASLWRFLWMMENKVVQIVQPDLNYNGGFVRALRVARMAKKFGLPIIPHNTQTGASAVNIVQFASAVENIGGYMEFPHRGNEKKESWYTPEFKIRNGAITVPTTPGLGIQFDPAYLAKAEKVSA